MRRFTRLSFAVTRFSNPYYVILSFHVGVQLIAYFIRAIHCVVPQADNESPENILQQQLIKTHTIVQYVYDTTVVGAVVIEARTLVELTVIIILARLRTIALRTWKMTMITLKWDVREGPNRYPTRLQRAEAPRPAWSLWTDPNRSRRIAIEMWTKCTRKGKEPFGRGTGKSITQIIIFTYLHEKSNFQASFLFEIIAIVREVKRLWTLKLSENRIM